jgi:HSP20 family molecular chaperone IbpA
MTADYFFTNFNNLWDSFTTNDWPRQVIPERACNLPTTPPCDCDISKDLNTLYLTFALAGYTKKDVEVSAGNNSVTLSTKKTPEDEQTNPIHRGISKKAHNLTLTIDESFDPKKAEVDFINGLLRITIPKTEEGKTIKLL